MYPLIKKDQKHRKFQISSSNKNYLDLGFMILAFNSAWQRVGGRGRGQEGTQL